MASKFYGGYRITEMRAWAREYKIAGRSKMTGDELLVALRGYWDARRQAAEQAVIEFATPGAVLRNKDTGDLVRVVEMPYTDPALGGAVRFKAEYIEIVNPHDLPGAWAGRGADRARYYNESNARADEAGFLSHSVHALWPYEAVAITEV